MVDVGYLLPMTGEVNIDDIILLGRLTERTQSLLDVLICCLFVLQRCDVVERETVGLQHLLHKGDVIIAIDSIPTAIGCIRSYTYDKRPLLCESERGGNDDQYG